MTQPTIYITKADANNLLKLLLEAGSTSYRGSPYLKNLREELDRAVIVDPEQIPPDIITMRSTAILIDAETGEEMKYTLVFPEAADLAQGKISILAPIGTGMLGCRVGNTFEWETPSGKRKIHVKEILFQPESRGDFQ